MTKFKYLVIVRNRVLATYSDRKKALLDGMKWSNSLKGEYVRVDVYDLMSRERAGEVAFHYSIENGRCMKEDAIEVFVV